jgi:hypothetical protein
MLPNFIMIGAPRAGTTWTIKNLRLHPEIFVAKETEIHFFDTHYNKGIEYYEEKFKGVKGELAIGEKTPDYLYNKKAPELMKRHLPDIKLIVILRNPVERLYSRYWNSKAKYSTNINLTFEEKIKKKPIFIEEGFYYDHLVRYFKYYPQDKFLILFFEDLLSQPYDFLNKIHKFLNVDATFISPLVERKINTAKSKKYLAKSRFLWNVQRALMRFKIYKLAFMIENINKNEYPKMNFETQKWLVDGVYKEQNYKLGKLLGIDLSHWNVF